MVPNPEFARYSKDVEYWMSERTKQLRAWAVGATGRRLAHELKLQAWSTMRTTPAIQTRGRISSASFAASAASAFVLAFNAGSYMGGAASLTLVGLAIATQLGSVPAAAQRALLTPPSGPWGFYFLATETIHRGLWAMRVALGKEIPMTKLDDEIAAAVSTASNTAQSSAINDTAPPIAHRQQYAMPSVTSPTAPNATASTPPSAATSPADETPTAAHA
jgi:hypothetical protein